MWKHPVKRKQKQDTCYTSEFNLTIYSQKVFEVCDLSSEVLIFQQKLDIWGITHFCPLAVS